MSGTKKGAKKGWKTRKDSVTLRKGDSLLRVAKVHKVDVKKLIEINKIKSPKDVHEGRTIKLK